MRKARSLWVWVMIALLVQMAVPYSGFVSPTAVHGSTANLALDKSGASSSSFNSTAWSTSRAFDGSLDTGWRNLSSQNPGGANPVSELNPVWLRVDLGIGTSFNQIRLIAPIIAGVDYGDRIKRFALQASNDGSTWSDLYATAGEERDTVGSGQFREFNFAAVTARYVRLAIYDMEPTAAIAEFEVYHIPAAGAQTIVLNKSATMLAVGDSETITATVFPVEADQAIVWSSSNGNVSVDGNGLITGIQPGAAVVTAASASNPLVQALVEVTVHSAPALQDLAQGRTYSSSTSYNAAAWGTSRAFDGSDESGWRNLSSQNPGGANPVSEQSPIWLRVDFGTELHFSHIRLIAPIIANVDYGDRIKRFALQWSNDGFTWTDLYATAGEEHDTIGSDAYRDFHHDTVQARYVRLAIYDTENTAAIGAFEIYNRTPVSAILLHPSSLNVSAGDSATVIAEVLPAYSGNPDVVWHASSPHVLVDSSGRVTGVSPGTASVTATSVFTPSVSTSMEVTVLPSSAKELTSFGLTVADAVYGNLTDIEYGRIDQDADQITVWMPQIANLSSLVAHYSTSGQEVFVGPERQISGVTVNDFSTTVTYRVYAADNSFRDYQVHAGHRAPSDKELVYFSLGETEGPAVGAIRDGHVIATVSSDADLTQLTAEFEVKGAAVFVGGQRQVSGETSNDYTQPVVYTVYGDDGSMKDYQVHVFKKQSSTLDNLALGKLATASSIGFYRNPPSDMTDGNDQTSWRRHSGDPFPYYAQVDLGEALEFNRIRVAERQRAGAFRLTGYSIYVSGDGHLWTKLADGGTIGATPLELDFNLVSARYIRFVITAEDTFDYPMIAEISAYKVTEPAIGMTMPDSHIGLLTGEEKRAQSRVLPETADQRVFWTSSDPAVAAVTSQGTVLGVSAGTAVITAISMDNPSHMAELSVTVLPQVSSAKALTSFRAIVPMTDSSDLSNPLTSPYEVIGSIIGEEVHAVISVNDKQTVDLSQATVVFETSGSQVSVNGAPLASGSGTIDLSGPVIVTVTAADQSTQSYTVTVQVLSELKDMTSFSIEAEGSLIPGVIRSELLGREILHVGDGQYTITDVRENTISVPLPETVDITQLTASFSAEGSAVYVGDVLQISGQTVNDFNSNVIYQVVAEDGSVKAYTIIVYRDPTEVTLTVTNEVEGASMRYVGYSTWWPEEETNVGAWYEYSNVNGVRHWLNPTTYIGNANVSAGAALEIVDVDSFDARRNDLRARMLADPEDSTYINWQGARGLYQSTGADYALQTFRDLDIDIIAELNDTSFRAIYDGEGNVVGGQFANEADKWQQGWNTWQKFYASAFHLAKEYDVFLFQGPNEPDGFIPGDIRYRQLFLEQFVFMNAIYSDAVHTAVADVNQLYGKSLVPMFGGPTLASSYNSDIGQILLAYNRMDYRGNPSTHNIMDIYIKQAYSTNSEYFGELLRGMTEFTAEHHPLQEPLLNAFTEFNYLAGANWANRRETSDHDVVFVSMSRTWAHAAKAGAYAMYHFKFSDVYDRNGNLVHYMFDQPRDPADNLLWGKPYTVSSEAPGFPASNVVLGAENDDIAWKTAEGAAGPHFIEWDLGEEYEIKSFAVSSGVNYTALSHGVLQYWNGTQWVNFEQGDVKGVQTYRSLNTPVTADKIRFYSTSAEPIAVRKVSVSTLANREIGGPMKSAEVTRLFAEGFKNERDLYRMEVDAPQDSKYIALTSLDPESGNYYVWAPQANPLVDYRITLDLSQLPVNEGDLVTVREVSDAHFGEVVYTVGLNADKSITLLQPKMSVWLITVHAGKKLGSTALTPVDDAEVQLGSGSGNNYGQAESMRVRQSTTVLDDNHAVYMKFNTADVDLGKVERAILRVYGQMSSITNTNPNPTTGTNGNAGITLPSINVYGIDRNDWTEETITGNTAPYLGTGSTVMKQVGSHAKPLGFLTYTTEGGYSAIDVTEFVRAHPDQEITFVLIKEKRKEQQINDMDYLTVSSKEAAEQQRPYLELWTPVNAEPDNGGRNGHPVHPEHPGRPGQPGHPGNPGQPGPGFGHPVHPGNPGNPGNPGHPGSP